MKRRRKNEKRRSLIKRGLPVLLPNAGGQPKAGRNPENMSVEMYISVQFKSLSIVYPHIYRNIREEH